MAITKKTVSGVFVTIVVLFICLCVGKYIADQKAKEVERQAERQKHIETLYGYETFALGMDQYHCYKDFSNVDVNRLTLKLAAYKHFAPEAPSLTIDEVQDFLSEEYDENGELRVLNQPDNIRQYVNWYVWGGGDLCYQNYLTYLTLYCNDSEKYKDIKMFSTDLETLNSIIDDFTNCPNRADYEF